MGPPSRMDLLIGNLGGRDKLPKKLPKRGLDNPKPPTSRPADTELGGSGTPQLDESATQRRKAGGQASTTIPDQEFFRQNGHNWWDPPEEKIMSPPKAQPTREVERDSREFEPEKGCPAPRGERFSPLIAVTKLCYKYVPHRWSQPLAEMFFDAGKIWNRAWDLYYIDPNHHVSANGKAILLVPERQVQLLIEQMNASFPNAKIAIGDDHRDDGLVVDFADIESEDLRPRWLGRTTSRAQVDTWWSQLQVSSPSAGGNTSGRDHQAFQEAMSRVEYADKGKKGGQRKKHDGDTARALPAAQDLERAQKFLGLRSHSGSSTVPDVSLLSLSGIDTAKRVPYAFEQEPIFISVDVEAHERNSSAITEVGLATLDTRDLAMTAPGEGGKGWQGFICARHFRVAEYFHHVNSEFVQGCPDRFEFGQSEKVEGAAISSTLASCFHPPFSRDHMVDREAMTRPAAQTTADSMPAEKRNIVLVGHDIAQDIAYLRKLGFDPTDRGNLIGTLDTASLDRAYTRGKH